MKKKSPAQKSTARPRRSPARISGQALADELGISLRTIQRFSKSRVLSQLAEGDYIERDALVAIARHALKRDGDKAALAAERLRKVTLEADALQREDDVAEGALLTLDQVKAVALDVVPKLKKWLRALLLSELPTKCQGRSQAQIRAIGAKSYNDLLRRMQAPHRALASGRLDEEGEEA